MINQISRAFVWGSILVLTIAGCDPAPKKRVYHYPPNSLRVVYEGAEQPTGCLVASVAMAANYYLGDHKYSENMMMEQVRQMGLNETRVGDLQKFLARDDLDLFSLTGQMSDEPPLGLEYLLVKRGYPVICIINRQSDDPAYNHAVVVIGVSTNSVTGYADTIHYFDPASPQQLHSDDAALFEIMWGRCHNAMMFVTRPPAD